MNTAIRERAAVGGRPVAHIAALRADYVSMLRGGRMTWRATDVTRRVIPGLIRLACPQPHFDVEKAT